MAGDGGERARRAAAIVIGNELLSGKIADANVQVLARTLRGAGIELARVVMIPDEIDTIAAEVNGLRASHEVVFTSGGVGPTHDDLTVDAVAVAFEVSVESVAHLEELLRAYYGERLTDGHLRMARVPRGARLIDGGELPWPTIVMGNVWVLPGVPQIFAMKMPVVKRELSAGEPFVSLEVFTRLDEGALKPHLDAVVAAHPAVAVGSYPSWKNERYRTLVTFDARDEAAVERARDDFIASLPAEAVV
jgi:molybdenum cofactor synthesis domain-containing protein